MPKRLQSLDLAKSLQIVNYRPKPGDFIIKFGWLTVRFGVVNGFIEETQEISVIFEGHPKILLGLTPAEMAQKTKLISLNDVRSNFFGKWAAMQQVGGEAIWYV
jgi:hypothetical protein